MNKQGPSIIIEPCGCTVQGGIPYRCEAHKLPAERDNGYGRTWNMGGSRYDRDLLTWQRAALIVGEALADIGPNAYYDLRPDQWMPWALAAIWHKDARIRSLEAETAALKAFHYKDSAAREAM